MSSIIPGIYVGGLTSARSESELNNFEITHICSAFQYPLNLVSSFYHIFVHDNKLRIYEIVLFSGSQTHPPSVYYSRFS